MNQLVAFVAAGGRIVLRGREFTLDGVTGDEDIKVATFRGARSTYTGVLCINATLPGKPRAEVWSIVGRGKTVGTFAIHEGQLVKLR